MRRAVAIAAGLLVLAGVPGADAKPVRCSKAVHAKPKSAKTGSKGCRNLPARPATVHAVVPMIGVNPFAAAPEPAPTPEVPTGDPAPPPPPSPAPARLGVVAREWSLTLSRTSLAAGPALVELQNFGEDAHNLRIERTDGSAPALDLPLAESGERQKAGGTLTPGEYRIYCALPGHEAQGMRAQLEVR